MPVHDKEFWQELELQPTDEVSAIHAARRRLVRIWHPDRAQSQDQEREYTERCQRINAAHDKAVRAARLQGFAAENQEWSEPNRHSPLWSYTSSRYRSHALACGVGIVGILLLIVPRIPVLASAIAFVVIAGAVFAGTAIEHAALRTLVVTPFRSFAQPELRTRRPTDEVVTDSILLIVNATLILVTFENLLEALGPLWGVVSGTLILLSVPVRLLRYRFFGR